MLTELTENLVTLDQAFDLAEARDLSYVMVPVPVFYQDNRSSFNEITRHLPESDERGADKFYIQIALFDVRARMLIDTATINARSGFFSSDTFPEALLATAFERYRAQLMPQMLVRH